MGALGIGGHGGRETEGRRRHGAEIPATDTKPEEEKKQAMGFRRCGLQKMGFRRCGLQKMGFRTSESEDGLQEMWASEDGPQNMGFRAWASDSEIQNMGFRAWASDTTSLAVRPSSLAVRPTAVTRCQTGMAMRTIVTIVTMTQTRNHFEYASCPPPLNESIE